MRIITKISKNESEPQRLKRVAAYARVSSGKDAMLHSLSAQISYYNNLIGRRGDWEFAGIYADEAYTGTKNERPEFQRLLTNCRAGKIDMVITKSLTRFARNTVTLLETVRELKLADIDVYFEKENIHSISFEGEFMLTILASYAQEESRSASENLRWRIRRMFEQGRPNTGNMLGYRLFDGKLYIIQEEAEIVRGIFSDYLSGMGLNAIMKKLIENKVPTKTGVKWGESSLQVILRNEKYSGDMLLQKTFRQDHLTKKRKMNRGQLPMFFVENSHEPIIDKETFARVQKEIKRRAAEYSGYQKPIREHLFTAFIRCGNCGKYYRRKQLKQRSGSPKPVWICRTYNIHGRDVCPSQHIPENILIQKTVEVLGVTEITRKILESQLSEIRIPGHNQIEYIFKDGHVEQITWQYPSRSNSWDETKRQAAREYSLALLERRD